MISTRSYSPREASILAAYGRHDDIFASGVETAPPPIRARQRPLPKERQENLYVAYDHGVSTKVDLNEHIASTAVADYIQTITSWIDSFSGIHELSIGSASISASGTSEELTQAEAVLWYQELKHLSVRNKTREALDLLFNHVEDAFDVADFHKLDCMLRQVNPKELPSEMLISVLRATSRTKESLASWRDLLSFARKLIEQERLPSRMLRGL